jgi:hypothetical protein
MSVGVEWRVAKYVGDELVVNDSEFAPGAELERVGSDAVEVARAPRACSWMRARP